MFALSNDSAQYLESSKMPLNRTAWTKHFADGFDVRELDEDSLIREEDVVIASGSPFGVRLDELRSEYADWPFIGAARPGPRSNSSAL
jgi:hypothetical protein